MPDSRRKILVVVGARPNLMKAAPLIEAMAPTGSLQPLLLHTDQHYDANMSQVFFDELGLPQPDIHLGVGSGSHAQQTARVMTAFEPVLEEHRPDWVVVVGDVNSTLACALVAAKLHIPVAHVEAGLRSFNRRMPEEINRVLTDALSDLLFTTDRQAGDNLRREGIPAEKIYFVGNVMIDTLLKHRERALTSDILERLGLKPAQYALLTLHRPNNVDHFPVLQGLLAALGQLSRRLPVVFPVHPRTRQRVQAFGLDDLLDSYPGIIRCEPLGYLEMLCLMAKARLALTDSGGVQEETTALGTPCLTLREETEWPVTVNEGTNLVIGNEPERLLAESDAILAGGGKRGRIPELRDGQAAGRIVGVLREALR